MSAGVMTKKSSACWLLAGGVLLTGSAQAQTFSKTEVITYWDNTTSWVVGQTASVSCTESIPSSSACDGDVVSATTYHATSVLPTATSAFGKPQSTMTYNGDGTLATVKDGRNNITTLSNWKRGIPQSIVYADSTSQSAVVDDNGWITSVLSEVGARTCYGYDAMGRLGSITQPSETSAGVCDTSRWGATNRSFVPVAATEYGIPAGHWRETLTTGNATKSTYYDALWRPLLVREYDAANVAATERFSRMAYDHAGRVEFASYPSTSSSPTTGVWTAYNALGRVTSVSQDSELGLLTTLTTYNSGFTTTVTNPRGLSTTTSYLTFDQPSSDWPLSISAPEGALTTIARDVFGKPTSLTRSGSGVVPVVRTYAYNVYQELCRSEEPETGATLYAYDAAGNLASSAAGLPLGTNCGAANSRTVSRAYDARNRLSTLTFPDSNGNQIWTYYGDGLPHQITTLNDGGATTYLNAYSYNNRRLMTGESSTESGWSPWSLGYGYDANGALASQSYPNGFFVNYSPNALGQPTQVTTMGGTYATNVSYFPNGAIKQFTYGNGIVHTMAQNARQLPARSTDSSGVLDLEYTFDGNANVQYIYDRRNPADHRYLYYDGLDRLTSAGSQMFLGDNWHYFTYDALDNLTSWKLAGVKDYATYSYTGNRLTSVQNTGGASVVGLTYDAQGNLANKNGQAYEFDYGNRLRNVPNKENYRYDGHGRRTMAWSPTLGPIWSLYSSTGQVMYTHDDRQGKGIDHIYLGGSLLATLDRNWGAGTTVTKFQHTDALGSPVAVTNASGAVIERTNWEPYGAAINKPNYQGVGYTGHVMDAATSLTYMQQRYYDPQIGRFLSVDPVTANSATGSNFNRYWYADNNPYSFIDPDGRQTKRINPGDTEEQRAAAIAARDQSSSAGGSGQPLSGAYDALRRIDQAVFGRVASGEHKYSNDTWACNDLKSSGCQEANLFDNGLVKHSAPFLTGEALKNGEVRSVPGLGDVQFEVDRSNWRVVNHTTPNHYLHKGSVERTIVRVGHNLFIRTEGQGSGLWPRLNSAISRMLWSSVDRSFLQRVPMASGR